MANRLQEMKTWVIDQLRKSCEPKVISENTHPLNLLKSRQIYLVMPEELVGEGNPTQYLLIAHPDSNVGSSVDFYIKKLQELSEQGIAVLPYFHMQSPHFYKIREAKARRERENVDNEYNEYPAADLSKLERRIAQETRELFYFNGSRIVRIKIGTEKTHASYDAKRNPSMPSWMKRERDLVRERGLFPEQLDPQKPALSVRPSHRSSDILWARFEPVNVLKQDTLIETERPCYLMETDHLTPAGKKKRSRRK